MLGSVGENGSARGRREEGGDTGWGVTERSKVAVLTQVVPDVHLSTEGAHLDDALTQEVV